MGSTSWTVARRSGVPGSATGLPLGKSLSLPAFVSPSLTVRSGQGLSPHVTAPPRSTVTHCTEPAHTYLPEQFKFLQLFIVALGILAIVLQNKLEGEKTNQSLCLGLVRRGESNTTPRSRAARAFPEKPGSKRGSRSPKKELCTKGGRDTRGWAFGVLHRPGCFCLC